MPLRKPTCSSPALENIQCSNGIRTYRSMKQNGGLRNKPLYLQSSDFRPRCQGNSIGKGEYFFNIQHWDTWISTYKQRNLDPYLTLYTKIKSKWIRDVNVRAKIITPLEANRRRSSRPCVEQRFLSCDTKSMIQSGKNS